MRSGLLCLCSAALFLGACTGSAADNEGQPDGSVAAGMNVSMNSAATAAGVESGQSITAAEDGLEFSYLWPSQAVAIPELDAWLRSNGAKLRARFLKQALEDKAAAARDGWTFNDYSYQEEYRVVADTPDILVLLSDGYVYTGGAHGMPVNTAIIWDRKRRQRLAIADMIALSRLSAVGGERFCTELDRQREEKRGEPVRQGDPDQLDDFTRCVDMTKQLILPVSGQGNALDGIRVLIGPYEAGPYAEGTYVIDLPMDESLMTAVKPAYRDAFATG